MRFFSGFVGQFVLLSFCASAAVGAPSGISANSADPSLQQLVTIQCTHVRLHTAVREIAEKTGVHIYCGRNEDDWHTRDIPVIVCVKNLPLGKLLKDLATATHLFLRSEKLEGKWYYRFLPDYKLEKKLKNYFKAVTKASLAQIAWDIDLAARFKDYSASDFKIDPKDAWIKHCLDDPRNKDLSIIFASLSQKQINSALAGNSIRIDANNASPELRDAILRQKSWPGDHSFSFWVRIDPSSGEACSDADFSEIDYAMADLKDKDFPPRPAWPQPPDDEVFNYSYNWKREIKLPASNIKKPVISDLLAAASKAADVNIIGEDFGSYLDGSRPYLNTLFGKKITTGNIFSVQDWRPEDGGKTLVGFDTQWIIRHRCLMPEAVYNDLVTRANGSGIELNDALPLADLHVKRMIEWYARGPLKSVTIYFSGTNYDADKPLWQLYYHLSPDQQAQAATKEGLSLGEIDPSWVQYALLTRARLLDPDSGQANTTEYKLACDPEAFANSVLRLNCREISAMPRYEWSGPAPSPEMMAYMEHERVKCYRLSIQATMDGKPVQVCTQELRFPVYSSKRVEEIGKADMKADKAKEPGSRRLSD